jgi:hypothetical protein
MYVVLSTYFIHMEFFVVWAVRISVLEERVLNSSGVNLVVPRIEAGPLICSQEL